MRFEAGGSRSWLRGCGQGLIGSGVSGVDAEIRLGFRVLGLGVRFGL